MGEKLRGPGDRGDCDTAPRTQEILFLFNHDAPHQAAHIASVARALVELRPDQCVTCATGTVAIRDHVEALLGPRASDLVSWLDIALPRRLEALLAPANRVAPVRRLLRLDHHAARLRRAALIVSTERTCLRLRRSESAGAGPRFVHVPHGSGDRAVTYHPGKARFDTFLVAGDKARRELVSRGVATCSQVRVVGYPKFDSVDLARRVRLFEDDRPVFVYNPHFDPFLSSWYDHGPALIDWFATGEGRRFNLIFAPHIMLFRKALHVSLEYRTARLRPPIKSDWLQAKNIIIDTGSRRLIDMTYTLGADAYIGDVSSQVYEFMIRPRPLFFIDCFSGDPRSREAEYPAWTAGAVAGSVEALTPLLAAGSRARPGDLERQRQLLSETFSYDPECPASARAAAALLELL